MTAVIIPLQIEVKIYGIEYISKTRKSIFNILLNHHELYTIG